MLDDFPDLAGTAGSGTVASLEGDGAVYCTHDAGKKTACRDFALPDGMTCARHKQYLEPVTAEGLLTDTNEHVTRKLLRLAPEAIDTLEEVMTDPGASAGVRAKAAEALLDRAGYRGAIEVKVSGEVFVNPSDIILERLERLAPRLPMEPIEDIEGSEVDIEDAVVVETPLEPAPLPALPVFE